MNCTALLAVTVLLSPCYTQSTQKVPQGNPAKKAAKNPKGAKKPKSAKKVENQYWKSVPSLFKSKKTGDHVRDPKGNTLLVVNKKYTRGFKIEVTTRKKGKKARKSWKWHGALYSIRSDGTISNVTNYSYGVQEGEYIAMHKNGTVTKRTPYRNGKKHGMSYSRRSDASLSSSTEWRDDKKHGRATTFFHVKGKIKGQVWSTKDFVDDVQVGSHKMYREDGSPASTTQYKDGEKVGKTVFHDAPKK